jgi:pSer/pThr/pTyr-binding forkhead associated (FHA) protein
MSKKKQVVLLTLIGPSKTQTYDIDKSEFILGRGDSSAVPIVDNGISREHLKVRLQDNLIQVQDLNSSNGTYVEGIKLNPMEFVPVRDTYTITFGNSQSKIKLKIMEVSEQLTEQAKSVEKETDHPPIVVDLSAFPKTEEDFKLSFKNVGLNLPKYKNPSEHAQEIIKEAEYMKHSIIKSADVYKTKIINETKIQTRKATEEAYAEYQKLIDRLLDDTRRELQRLKTETEILLDDKRLQANEEIQNMWKEHRELIRKDKEKQLEVIEKENIIKLELSIEKMKSDMFSEKNRMITDAENEILHKKRQYQVEFENEKSEHLSRIKLYSDELAKIQALTAESERQYKENKSLKEDSDLELIKVMSQLKQEKENIEFAKQQYSELLELHKKIEGEIAQFEQIKAGWQQEQDNAAAEFAAIKAGWEKEQKDAAAAFEQVKLGWEQEQKDAEKKFEDVKAGWIAEQEHAAQHLQGIKNQWQVELEKAERERGEQERAFTALSEKKDQIEEQIRYLSQTLEDSKKKAKEELDNEYKNLKAIEAKKFDDYKANEIKELQKIRDNHTNAIKKFSVDLSQEIASKVEMLAKKSPAGAFDFEKNFELINSVIQVKSAINTGSESKHAEQLDDWKKRKRKENLSLMSSGFAIGIIAVFLGNFAYKRLNTDPVQEELARQAVERKIAAAQNAYVPQKTSQYYDTYVEATLYTENFTETYLDESIQQEWVSYATKYFLRQWKVEEERVIKVIANSRALVQSIEEAKVTLKKDRIKSDLEKLKAMEKENVETQSEMLGTNVKYEAYKKLEREFFSQRIQRRPASK